ncbi:MAG: hypothetical protein J0I47_10095 [Sphingomonas sp.]|uniref:hypothetical protein n=1 Tax=Sphingomonas sp. TaxID=28214 RepID=UPI001AC9EE53|nr:hypothetical protein [Sphingomonas sp.]MBN8808565.1 hypothetical protein [Sphingomonas sp.]
MLFTTVNQYAVLGLCVLLGLVLGLMLAPKGTKWRRRYEAERDAHATYRTDTDTRLREQDSLGTNRDAYVRDLERDNAALKDEVARLKS